jgi:hypothetical protein
MTTASRHPAPRPALRRAADATVHPAAAHLEGTVLDLSQIDPLPAPPASGKAKKGGKGREAGETAEIVVVVPKSLRKRVKAKAGEHGMSAEEATAHLLRVWVDG